jgi:hypothetical protein
MLRMYMRLLADGAMSIAGNGLPCPSCASSLTVHPLERRSLGLDLAFELRFPNLL